MSEIRELTAAVEALTAKLDETIGVNKQLAAQLSELWPVASSQKEEDAVAKYSESLQLLVNSII